MGLTDEPTIGQIHVEFFNQASFATDSIDIAHKEHLEQNHRINGWTTVVMAVQRVSELFNEIKIDVSINEPKKVILRNEILKKAHLELKLRSMRY